MKPGTPGPIILDELDADSVTVQTDTPKHFVFDKVFGPDATQVDVCFKFNFLNQATNLGIRRSQSADSKLSGR